MIHRLISSRVIKEALSGPVSEELADSVTGIIGLREAITTKHKLLKCIWAFLFCVGIGATIFFVYQTIEEYLDEPTMTRVRSPRVRPGTHP